MRNGIVSLRSLFICGVYLSIVYTFSYNYLYAMPASEASLGYKIYIQPVALVQGDMIYLHDIARFDSSLADSLIERVKSIPLWDSPKNIGTTVVFSEVAIRKRVREVLGKDALFCTYPSTLTIQRGGAIIYKKEIEEYVRDALLPRLEEEYHATIEIDEMRLPEYLLIADPKSKLHVEVKRVGLPKSVVTLLVMNPLGKKEQQHPLSVTVHAYKNALCAKEHIERYTALDDLVEQCTYNASLIGNAFIKYKEHTYRAKKSIPKGMVIVDSDVEAVPHIVKGTMIDLLYNKNGVHLSTKATALTDAYIGEHIKVQPSYSKKSIHATVRDEHTAVVQ